MIVSLHVATGAAAGALAPSRRSAVALGALLHAVGDRIPHQDIASRRFELVCGLAGIGMLAVFRGPLDRTTLGAVAASVPDAEHVVRLPRPRGRKLFPSHRIAGWHRPGWLPASVQLLAAGALLGAVLHRARAAA